MRRYLSIHSGRRGRVLIAVALAAVAWMLFASRVEAVTRPHTLEVDPGEVVVLYDGRAESTNPQAFCQGGQCGADTAYGVGQFSVAWDVVLVFTPTSRARPLNGYQSLYDHFSAAGDIAHDSSVGYTGPPALASFPPKCSTGVVSREDRYLAVHGRPIVLQRGVGKTTKIALEAPTGWPYIETPDVSSVNPCFIPPTATPGILISSGSFGPQGSEAIKLASSLAPHLIVKPGVLFTRREFNFKWAGNNSHSSGPYANTHIDVHSAVRVLQFCKSFDLTAQRCKT